MEPVRLAELCAATSLFTDLGTGQPSEHGLRTCLVAMRLAEALGIEPDELSDVYYVALLRFLGCTADAGGMARLAGGDDVGFLAGMAPVAMGSPREEIARMVHLVGAGQKWPQRLRTLARAFTDAKAGERLLSAHCEVGARLATEMGLPGAVARGLEAAYARWDGRGVPTRLAGETIPISVRISIVARDVELWVREAGLVQPMRSWFSGVAWRTTRQSSTPPSASASTTSSISATPSGRRCSMPSPRRARTSPVLPVTRRSGHWATTPS